MCGRWSTAEGLKQGPKGRRIPRQGRTGKEAVESEREGKDLDEVTTGERHSGRKMEMWNEQVEGEEGRGGSEMMQSDGRIEMRERGEMKVGSSSIWEREDKWTVGRSQGWERWQQHQGMRDLAMACGQEVRWLWWRQRQRHSRQTPSLPLMLPPRARQPAEAVKVYLFGFSWSFIFALGSTLRMRDWVSVSQMLVLGFVAVCLFLSTYGFASSWSFDYFMYHLLNNV